MRLQPWRRAVQAEVVVPGDKSMTHRGILFSALARGTTEVRGWLDAEDTRASLALVQQIGVRIAEHTRERLVLSSPGLDGVTEPEQVIDCRNSGTTMRLGLGLLTAVSGLSVLTGDESLRRRPMRRVLDPLARLGVTVFSRSGGLAPVAIQGGPHRGGEVTLAIASAQVKSALLLAGLSAQEPVTVTEPVLSRDHTDRLLRAMGARVESAGLSVRVYPGALQPAIVDVPGDPSSAAFWAALAALLPGSAITVPSVLLNPTRAGFFDVLERMGVSVRRAVRAAEPELVGDLSIRGSPIAPVSVEEADIPKMIDEVPLVALLATQAPGTSTIRGAKELRVKESDRIHVTANILTAMGARVQELEDGWIIDGPTPLCGARLHAQGDHRMAMLAAVAAAAAQGDSELEGAQVVQISYPQFFAQYQALRDRSDT